PTELREILDLFAADFPLEIQRIAGALAKQDREALRMAAHAAKGAAGSAGAPVLWDLLKGMEQEAKSAEFDTLSTTLHDVEAQFARVKQEIDSICHAETSASPAA